MIKIEKEQDNAVCNIIDIKIEKEQDNAVCNIIDNIFLLSEEEYNQYKDKIPCLPNCWWLRSPGVYNENDDFVMDVNKNGVVNDYGMDIIYRNAAIRPMLCYDGLEERIVKSAIRENRFIFNDFPFIIIDEEKKLAIAEMPISFGKFDDYSNVYEESHIRKWLLNWLKTGK